RGGGVVTPAATRRAANDLARYRGTAQPVARREPGGVRAERRHLREAGRQRSAGPADAHGRARVRAGVVTGQPADRVCARAGSVRDLSAWWRRAKARRLEGAIAAEDDRVDARRRVARGQRDDVLDLRELVRRVDRD